LLHGKRPVSVPVKTLTAPRDCETLDTVRDDDSSSFDTAIDAHDAAIAARGPVIWIGSEPTFTNRRSESPEWLSEALGDSKQDYALRIVRRLHRHAPGSLVLRTLGRQYSDEERPRWSLGLYQRRDGTALADGLPPDPLGTSCACDQERLATFWRSLATALDRDGRSALAFQLDGDMGLRIVWRCDAQPFAADPKTDTRLARAALQTHAVEAGDCIDDLAAQGLYLVSIGHAATGPQDALQPCLDLPGFSEVAQFLDFVRQVAHSAAEAGLDGLVWRGFPPPVDEHVAWTTVTPDPAVIEINAAPAATLGEFLERSRMLYAVADDEGLAPYRLQYNGHIGDSGGGGQFTLGGPSPMRSPFIVAPQLLPRLIRYLNRHPALSYWFAPSYVGSSSQSPRPDENVLESFNELQVALQRLDATPDPEPEFIWRSLSPFLVDTSGNAHRSELNIEKLWNPGLPARGCLGLVEFRAFRMALDPEHAAAIAALLRALAAMLCRQDEAHQLVEWGSRLHDRFALPFYLRRDLEAVFDDLETSGLGLGEPIIQRLLGDEWRHIGHTEYAGCRLDVEQAIEFWPLVGDAATQTGGSRLVDASTLRLQLTLRPCDDRAADLDGWQLLAGRFRLTLRSEHDATGTLRITGLRYRAFVPWTGLHPGIGAQVPVVLTLLPPDGERALRVTLHDWQPQGKPYQGLPDSLDEARQRISERFVVEDIPRHEAPEAVAPAPESLSDYCFDLRRA
jgi:uncharacterized protein (DUF2126 family)